MPSEQQKKNYVAKVMVILLTCILFITGIGIENISAFWNNDNPAFGDKRQLATITIQLIHCYHNDANDPLYSTHYDSSGRHKMDGNLIRRTILVAGQNVP